MSRVEKGHWRVGYTKFALRMLGELVEVQFEAKPNAQVMVGDVVGTIEGFKAISDIYCVGKGKFVTGNNELLSRLEDVQKSPYEAGWLYQIAGEPDRHAVDVEGYQAVLDATIDRLLAKQRHEEDAP